MKKENNKFILDTLIFSIQHNEDISSEKIKEEIEKHLIIACLKEKYSLNLDIKNKFINSSSRFEIGGLDADTGATNRKLAVDSYGSICRHGGGGYSGKDLTKVDRLGAYYARWICKNLVASGVCEFIELQVIFYLGGIKPINFVVRKDKNTNVLKEEIVAAIEHVFPQNLSEIISIFQAANVRYSALSVYGHFGRDDLDLPWEKLDKVKEIRQYFKDKNAR